MGFLDSVKDALRGAVSTRAPRDEEATGAPPEDVVDTSSTDTSASEPTTAPVAERSEKFDTYTVKSGDTLSEICAREGVSSREIARINNIENPDLIFPGQVFRIPKKN